jgi:hypothetical protein
VLDAVTHGYSTLLRSHTGAVLAIECDPSSLRAEVDDTSVISTCHALRNIVNDMSWYATTVLVQCL